MASSTPISSSLRPEQHDSHPYPIKTSHTGLLTRSNSSKTHGSWSRHHYTPSPTAFGFDNPQSSPSPMRRQSKSTAHSQPVQASPSSKSHRNGSPRGSERASKSPSNYSRSWVARNSDGDQVKLPRHPYLWTPAQLCTYLSSGLYGSDDEPLDSTVVVAMIDFIRQQKIGGRAFLSLEQEDFQEMEGVDPLWSNALWDASCTLRQRAAPYRPSRISSSAYKRGRVRGVVDFFERSASESSDIGEDDVYERSPDKIASSGRRVAGKNPYQPANKKWDFSESEDESRKLGLGHPGHIPLPRNIATRDNLEVSRPSGKPPVKGRTSSMLSVGDGLASESSSNVHVGQDFQEPARPLASGTLANDTLTVVLPPQSETPVNVVLGSDDLPHRLVGSPEPELMNDHTPNQEREVEIVSIHPREESEPTMAELYERTYGFPPPLSRGEKLVTRPSEDLPGSENSGETVKVAPIVASSDQPPTALRPVVQRKASSLPRSLRHLFFPSPELQANSDRQTTGIYTSSMDIYERDEVAIHTIDALKERVAIVERRLEAMELKELEVNTSNVLPHHAKASRTTLTPIEDELDELDHKIHSSRPEEVLRTRQSAYVLLVGATTGISMILIPLLLRHLWSR